MNKIMVRTVDTDVVMVCIGVASQVGADWLWIAFASGVTYCYIDVTAVADILGQDKFVELIMFHASIGCDVTSSFMGKGTA